MLRAALGYGWSVAVGADPSITLRAFTSWTVVNNPDFRMMVRQNLGTARFAKASPEERARLAAAVG